MQHRGEIVKNAIHQSGYSITKLALKLGKSRRWMYQMFDNSNVSLEIVLQIGEIIHYDFTDEIRGFKKSAFVESRETNYSTPENTVEFWKDKYLKLLEDYNALLLRK
jgi:predicted transcriptional regulator